MMDIIIQFTKLMLLIVHILCVSLIVILIIKIMHVMFQVLGNVFKNAQHQNMSMELVQRLLMFVNLAAKDMLVMEQIINIMKIAPNAQLMLSAQAVQPDILE